LIACGYAWKSGGGSHAGDVRVGAFGELDFGLSLLVFEALGAALIGVLFDALVDLTDFDLRFIRDVFAVGFGVAGVVSDATVAVRFMERLRGRDVSARVLIDRSEKAETGGVSSGTAVTMLL